MRLLAAIGVLALLLAAWAAPVGEPGLAVPQQTTTPPPPRPPSPNPPRPGRCTPNVPCCPTALALLTGPPCRVGCPGPPPRKLADAALDLASVAKPYPSGVVILELVIDEKGVPLSSCVLRGVRQDVDHAAQVATLKWRFEPKALDGKSIGVVMTVTMQAPGSDPRSGS